MIIPSSEGDILNIIFMADQVFTGEVVAVSPTANNLTSGFDFNATTRIIEKGSSFGNGEHTEFTADGSTAPEVTWENFILYYTNGTTSSDSWNYSSQGITQFRVEDPNYDEYACTFKSGTIIYEFTDSNNDKGSGATWSDGQVFNYNGTAPANPLQGLLRKDYDFEDFTFLNRQTAPESAFGGNALDERFRLTRCTLDFRNNNTNSGNIGVPFFGSNVIMDEVKIIKADDAYGDAAIFISNPGEVKGLTVDGGFLKNEHKATGIYSGVAFQGAGTNGALNYPCQYYSRGNNETDVAGLSDRMMRLIDCEVDADKAFVSGRAGFMVYRSLQVEPFVYDTSDGTPDNSGVHVHVMRKGSGDDDYSEFFETYDEMDITVASATVGDVTKSYAIGQSDNTSYSTVGSIENAWVDIGNPYFAGDRLRISNAHSSINGVHELPDTYFGAIFLDPDFTATNGNYENAKFEILPPVSATDGTFNLFRVPILRILGDTDSNANFTSVATFNSNTNRNLTAAIAVGDDSSHANAANWDTDLYYLERDIRVSVVPPYPYEIINTDFNSIAYELSNAQSGSGLTVVPGVVEIPNLGSDNAETVLLRTSVSDLTEMAEVIYAFRRELNTDSERDNVLSESGTVRPDKEFISQVGSRIEFLCEDVEFVTTGELITYTTSNSDNGKLTIRVDADITDFSSSEFDTIDVPGDLTGTGNIAGINYKDSSGVLVTINLPESVETRYKVSGGSYTTQNSGTTIQLSGQTASNDIEVAISPRGYEAQLLKFNTGAFGVTQDPTWNAYETAESASSPSWVTNDRFTVAWIDNTDSSLFSGNDYLRITQNTADSTLDAAVASSAAGDLSWAIQREEGYLDYLISEDDAGEKMTTRSNNIVFFPSRVQFAKGSGLTLDTELSVPIYTSADGNFNNARSQDLSTPKNDQSAKWTMFNNNSTPNFDTGAVIVATTNALNAKHGTPNGLLYDTDVEGSIEKVVTDTQSAAEGAEALSA